jgi:hypothetical protein
MRKSLTGIAFLPVIGLLVFASGCNLTEPLGTEKSVNLGAVVWKAQFCVRFDEVNTTGSFVTEVVCDKFATRIFEQLADDGISLDDIEAIAMVGGTVKLLGQLKGHNWVITSRVDICRQDDPNLPPTDGPETLVNESVCSLEGIKKAKTPVDLNAAGVAIVDQALEDLINGGDPRLLVKMVGSDVDPTPSEKDPMLFKWQACIEVQAVVSE